MAGGVQSNNAPRLKQDRGLQEGKKEGARAVIRTSFVFLPSRLFRKNAQGKSDTDHFARASDILSEVIANHLFCRPPPFLSRPICSPISKPCRDSFLQPFCCSQSVC